LHLIVALLGAQGRSAHSNSQSALKGQFPSTLTPSERGELLGSLQTLLDADRGRDSHSVRSDKGAKLPQHEQPAALKSRPCGFGRFAHIPCDTLEREQLLAPPRSAEQLASVEAPAGELAPAAQGDLSGIQVEMAALESAVAQQDKEIGAQHAEIDQLKKRALVTPSPPSTTIYNRAIMNL
jgi:hypothetical protein